MIDYLDEDVAYLLGLIVARGTFVESGGVKRLIIEFPFKSLEAQGINKRLIQRVSIKSSLNDVIRRVEELADAAVRLEDGKHTVRLIIESLKNTIFWRNIYLLLNGKRSYTEFGIPSEILTANKDIKKEFLRGFADVAGSARYTNRDEAGRCRIYLDVLNANWYLPVQICYLLQDELNIPVRTIAWGHPNIRDPDLRDYNRGLRETWAREHQIKVYVEDFEKIGFYIFHKQEILEELAEYNRRKFRHSCNFCSFPKKVMKEKPKHPEENSNRLPPAIRGKHFDTYWQICCELGCERCIQYRRMNPTLFNHGQKQEKGT